MKKLFIILAASMFVVGAVAATISWQHRRTTNAEIWEAYASVLTVEDYIGADDGSFAQADIAAREKLDTLESRDLRMHDQQVVECVGDLLGAVESLKDSHSLETAALRTDIAKKAIVKAAGCMQKLN
jgi:hypothetical protein